MRTKKMVNDIPMSVIYSGMSTDRLFKLNMLADQAWDTAVDRYRTQHDAWPEDEVVRHEAEAEFRKLLDRSAIKAEWNNKKHNKVASIVKSINRKKKVSK